MKKETKFFIGAFTVIALGAYLVYRFISKSKSETTDILGTTPSTSGTTPSTSGTKTSTIVSNVLPLATYPLKNGSKGSNVIVLQKWLNDNSYASPKLVPDGAFGSKTEMAVKQMQQFPNQKAILDYNSFNTSFKIGQVTKDFYEIFVTKTKAMPSSSNNLFGL
jgi:peptidoglycan hydrolase-like protein with peptidoglycan-binding domain